MDKFVLKAPYQPTGDQPQAIEALEKAHEEYEKYKKGEESRLSLVEQHFLDSINELEGLEEKG